MVRNDFAIFILTHGRAGQVKTIRPLIEVGNYTGKLYFVIDNEDDQADEYYRLYGDRVIMFDKIEIAKRVDPMDNFNNRCAILYARHACWDIAEDLGLKYFLMLDDDYSNFMYRFIDDNKLKGIDCRQMDRLCETMLDFLDVSGADTVALGQGGDFIGGVESSRFKNGIMRKAMNSFFCRVDRKLQFAGTMNEDVVYYSKWSRRGKLVLSIANASIVQIQSQSLPGGMTGSYEESGTYIKSFYSVMAAPSCCEIAVMGDKHKRVHHRVNANTAYPKIISSEWKK